MALQGSRDIIPCDEATAGVDEEGPSGRAVGNSRQVRIKGGNKAKRGRGLGKEKNGVTVVAGVGLGEGDVQLVAATVGTVGVTEDMALEQGVVGDVG